jgi:hypothetical protein
MLEWYEQMKLPTQKKIPYNVLKRYLGIHYTEIINLVDYVYQ